MMPKGALVKSECSEEGTKYPASCAEWLFLAISNLYTFFSDENNVFLQDAASFMEAAFRELFLGPEQLLYSLEILFRYPHGQIYSRANSAALSSEPWGERIGLLLICQCLCRGVPKQVVIVIPDGGLP